MKLASQWVRVALAILTISRYFVYGEMGWFCPMALSLCVVYDACFPVKG